VDNRTYIAIDLKSFYASVECADRKVNPLTTNLVVADITRTEKTICLAVSPSLKAKGVPGRPRLFEVIQKVKEINRQRLSDYRKKTHDYSAKFISESFDALALEKDSSLELSYIVAPPRMARYMEVSSQIYSIYLKYVSKEDVIVYSIDEVFIDATAYLNTYQISAQQFAMRMIREVLYTTGITATAGIGTNLFLAKVAMDIVAKHMEPDENGVRMAELNEMSFRKILWSHKPLTDVWRIGPGIARKLEQNGMFTLGDVARMSVTRHPVVAHIEKPKKGESATQIMQSGEDLLYKLFGINAELIIDHAWGWEPCTVDYIKQYKPESNSLGSGQVLHEPYTYDKARIIVMEMADELSMSLVRKGLATDRIELYIGFDRESLIEDHGIYKYRDGKIYKGKVTEDPYGRIHPKHANGNFKLDFPTSSTRLIIEAAVSIFEQKVDKGLLVRRVGVSAMSVIPEKEAEKIRSQRQNSDVQMDLFTDYDALEAERQSQEEQLDRERRLQEAVLTIKDKFGKNAVLKGLNYQEGARGRERNNEVGGHKA
jgi:DNA polymerase V